MNALRCASPKHFDAIINTFAAQVAAAWQQKQTSFTDGWLTIIQGTWQVICDEEESDSEAQHHVFLKDISDILEE